MRTYVHSQGAALKITAASLQQVVEPRDIGDRRPNGDSLRLNMFRQPKRGHVMFISRGKIGPFRVEGNAHVGGPGRIGVRMLLHDEGNGDKAVTSAAAIFDIMS